jgi:hypothetical protein
MKPFPGELAGFEKDLHGLIDAFAVIHQDPGAREGEQSTPVSPSQQADRKVPTFAQFKELWISLGFSYIHQVRKCGAFEAQIALVP